MRTATPFETMSSGLMRIKRALIEVDDDEAMTQDHKEVEDVVAMDFGGSLDADAQETMTTTAVAMTVPPSWIWGKTVAVAVAKFMQPFASVTMTDQVVVAAGQAVTVARLSTFRPVAGIQ